MKAIVKIGMWKAIAFLTVVSCIFSCSSCEPEFGYKPQITIGQAENVSSSSATLVAFIVPNGEAQVSFSYKAGDSDWFKSILPGMVSGDKKIKVTLDLSDLEPGTEYQFKVETSPRSASESPISKFTTLGRPKPIVEIDSASNVKITSAKLKAKVITILENTSLSFEYRTKGTNWLTQELGGTFSSGLDTLKVDFDLSALQANTYYEFRLKAKNIAGETISDIATFQTYAVSDYDGNLYHTVTIGEQTWLKENFKGTHYANGDPILHVTDANTWSNLSSGAYCYYNNDPELGEIYGAMYNWWVGVDPRGLIPGWRMPTGDEFVYLNNYLDTSNYVLSGLMLCEASDRYWNKSRPDRIRTNSSGFTALPNGNLSPSYKFDCLKDEATFWGSDFSDKSANFSNITKELFIFSFSGYANKNYGLGIRMIKK